MNHRPSSMVGQGKFLTVQSVPSTSGSSVNSGIKRPLEHVPTFSGPWQQMTGEASMNNVMMAQLNQDSGPSIENNSPENSSAKKPKFDSQQEKFPGEGVIG